MNPEPCLQFVPSVIHQGKRIRAFGRQAYLRHPDETFVEFLAVFLRELLGREWWDGQMRRQKPHIILKWYKAVGAWRKQFLTDKHKLPNGQYATLASGNAWSLSLCAYDMLILFHKGYLSDGLLNRIRNFNEFQGTRYEIAAAAIFIRSGYKLRFLEPVNGQKICEFIATHPSEVEVAVEAKSRQRPGVLNRKGVSKEEYLPDMKSLYEGARKKKPGMPFVILLDMNLPPSPRQLHRPYNTAWLNNIKKMLMYFPEPTAETPDIHNGLIFTNFAFYYQGDSVMDSDPPLSMWSLFQQFPVPDTNIWPAIMGTVQRYTTIPREV